MLIKHTLRARGSLLVSLVGETSGISKHNSAMHHGIHTSVQIENVFLFLLSLAMLLKHTTSRVILLTLRNALQYGAPQRLCRP